MTFEKVMIADPAFIFLSFLNDPPSVFIKVSRQFKDILLIRMPHLIFYVNRLLLFACFEI